MGLAPGSSPTCAEEDKVGPGGSTKGPSLSPPSVLHPRQSPLRGLFPLIRASPTHTSQWLFGDWGVRAGVRESPGRPLGWQPQPLGLRTIPGLVAAPPLRRHLGRPVAPRRGHSRKGRTRKKWNGRIGRRRDKEEGRKRDGGERSQPTNGVN